MNYKMISLVIGKMFKLLAGFMLIPLICSFIYEENRKTTYSYIFTIILCLIIYFIINNFTKNISNKSFFNKEGFVIVTVTWILFSIFGALPFYISGEVPSYIDAFFETVSGFTTTGSSVLTNIEELSNSLLLWRSFTHFIGGCGVIVFALIVLPKSPNNIHIAKAEVPGPFFGKTVSSMKKTAVYLYATYIGLSLIMFLLLIPSKIGFFDNINIVFSTAGTGGLSIKNTGIAYYNNDYLTIVVSIFMILFSMNLNIFYFIIVKRYFNMLKSQELRWFLGFILAAFVLIFINIHSSFESIKDAVIDIFFIVSSIISTTGFFYIDFDTWPIFSKYVLLLLMVVGGCAGGTAGGLKVSRIIFMIKIVKNYINKSLNPKKISILKIEDKPIKEPEKVANYLLLYFLVFAFSLLFMTIQINDLEEATSLVLTALNNVGPGLKSYGPINNFSDIPDFTKILLSFLMLLGRLEIIPFIVLFSSKTWRKKIK